LSKDERTVTRQFILDDMLARLAVKHMPYGSDSDSNSETGFLGESESNSINEVRHELKTFIKSEGLAAVTPHEARAWWDSHKEFPHLRRYAALYFSAQCTEVDNEREFSSSSE
jgi:hypothetical protein